MGRRGPTPKPTAIKIAQGVRPDRINNDEPRPDRLAASPDPPAHLDDVARELWNQLAPTLHQIGVLTSLDLPMLSVLCETASIVRAASTLLQAGVLSRGRRDQWVTNPAWRTYRDATALLLSLAREFGLTPSSRSGIIFRLELSPPSLDDRQKERAYGPQRTDGSIE